MKYKINLGEMMKTLGNKFGWLLFSLTGAFALGVIALRHGEPIGAIWIVIAAVCVYIIAYRFYSLFIANQALKLDSTRMTPAYKLNDGLDHVPTNKYVLFGHKELNTALDPNLIKPKVVSFYETGTFILMVFCLIFSVLVSAYAFHEGSIIAFLTCMSLFALLLWFNERRRIQNKQIAFIDSYQFPSTVPEIVSKHYPHLSEHQLSLVMQGLRQYFQLCRVAHNATSMPSKIVDLAWHEFLLYTKSYANFCKYGVGHFVHHTPTQEMTDPSSLEEGMKETWYQACAWEGGIDQRAPSRLPFLFAIDAALDIPDGFYHDLKNDYAKNIITGGGCGGNGCGGCGGG